MVTVAVVGSGVVGRRIVRRLPVVVPDATIVEIDTRECSPARDPEFDRVDVAVLAHGGPHHDDVVGLAERGISLVSVADDVNDVSSLLAYHDRARSRGVSIVAGGGMAPGLTGLLARHLATDLHRVDEIHVAYHGTAGPACARQHHRALSGRSVSVHDHVLVRHRAGTGRELNWFPEPVGAYDCYRAESPLPVVLRRDFPTVSRITARMSATRRDRFTSQLPMLTPPHPEGGVGAIRVELRGGLADGSRCTLIGGIAELVGTAAAVTATAFVERIVAGGIPAGVITAADPALDTVGLLRTIERLGVRLQEFTGVPNA
jgi:hypothetical protein